MALEQVGDPMPLTEATRVALNGCQQAAVADLLLLEFWEVHKPMHLGWMLRVRQIRQANPGLVAEIEAELAIRRKGCRPGRMAPAVSASAR